MKDRVDNLRYIPRANDPNKSLSKSARLLVGNYHDMIIKSKSGTIFVDHDFISSITEVGQSQNKNLHNQLRKIFDIKYHKAVIVNGKKYKDGFTIELTKNTEEILQDPKGFYANKGGQIL